MYYTVYVSVGVFQMHLFVVTTIPYQSKLLFVLWWWNDKTSKLHWETYRTGQCDTNRGLTTLGVLYSAVECFFCDGKSGVR